MEKASTKNETRTPIYFKIVHISVLSFHVYVQNLCPHHINGVSLSYLGIIFIGGNLND